MSRARIRRFLALALAAACAASAAGTRQATLGPHRPVAARPPPVTIALVGDTMLGNTPQLPAHPERYLDRVEKALAADVTFGNLEGTLTTATDSKCSPGSTACFAFRVPPKYARYLRGAGFDVLNSANNHSHDFGSKGVEQTSAALQNFGIVQDGLRGQIGVFEVDGVRIAFAGFAPYATVSYLLNLDTAAKLIDKAGKLGDIVVVYMHAGAEGADKTHVTGQEEYYLGEDRGNPRRFAHMAIDHGADLVVASGPHVLRGMEFYKRHLIAYSLANFASYHNFGTDGVLALTGVLRVELGPSGWFRSARLLGVRMSDVGRPHRDYSGDSVELVRQLSRHDFAKHAARLADDGTISLPSA